MASFNRVVLVGNLTRDVEIRYTPSGTAVTDVSIAVNDRVKRNNEWVDETSYFDITLWGRTAEVAGEYLSKGSSILVEGRLKQDRWEQDGQKRSKVKVIGEKMQMLGAKGGGGGGGGGNAPHSASQSTPSTPSTPHTAPSQQPAGSHGNGSQVASSQPAPAQAPPSDDDVPF